jgi:CHAT domain-containing protein
MTRALEIREKALGADHPHVAGSLRQLASLHQIRGDFARAEPLYRRALTISEEMLGRQHPHVATILEGLATCRLAENERAAAESLLAAAADVFESARSRAGGGFARATFQTTPYRRLAAVRLGMGNSVDAWPATERALGRVIAELLIASGQRDLTAVEAAREDSLRRSLGDLEDRLTALQTAARTDSSAESRERFQEVRVNLTAAEAAWSVFQNELASRYPVTEGRPYSLERVQAALTDETALLGWLDVEVMKGQVASWGYVLRGSGPVQWVRLGTAQERATGGTPAKIQDLRKTLRLAAAWRERVWDVDEVTGCGHDVWMRRVRPLMPHLEGVENLVVIPAGPMLGVPVEALVDETGTHLVERFAVSYAPSAKIYTWLQERSGTTPQNGEPWALLLGDPPFRADHLLAMQRDAEEKHPLIALAEPLPEPSVLRSALAGAEEALEELPRLPWTRREVRNIASTVPRSRILLGSDASEQELSRLAASGELKKFDWIHLATHALIDDEHPWRSALVLSRVNLPDPLESVIAGNEIFDGLLNVQEIMREWDLSADLVALSACRTGLGKEIAGEGYIGLAHGLLQAGARTLLVSLWRIEDEPASLLMGRFYENILRSRGEGSDGGKSEPISKAKALQEAKRWLRAQTDQEGRRPYQHPVYWSGFVLMGAPE